MLIKDQSQRDFEIQSRPDRWNRLRIFLFLLWVLSTVPLMGSGRSSTAGVHGHTWIEAAAFQKNSVFLVTKTESNRRRVGLGSQLTVLMKVDSKGQLVQAIPVEVPPRFQKDVNARLVDAAASEGGRIFVLLMSGVYYAIDPSTRSVTRLRAVFPPAQDSPDSSLDFWRIHVAPGPRIYVQGGATPAGWIVASNIQGKSWKVISESGHSNIYYGLIPIDGNDALFTLRYGPKKIVLTATSLVDGKQIVKVPMPTNLTGLQDLAIDCVSLNAGSALVAGSNASGDPTMIYYSADNGRSWRAFHVIWKGQDVDKNTSEQVDYPLIQSCLLLGHRTGVVVLTDRILRTKDGGNSWQTAWQKKGSTLTRIYKTPWGDLWVLDGNSIVASSDQGQSWSILVSLP